MQREFGVPGVSLARGDHVCALYHDARGRNEVLVPYVEAGVRAGDKCYIAIDSEDPGAFVSSLGSDGAAAVATGQIEVQTLAGARRLRGATADQMLGFWDEALAATLDTGGYRFARLGGEATWWLTQGCSGHELVRYESELNRYTTSYSMSVLCLYDLTRFSGGLVVDLVRTHSRIMLGQLVLENPHRLTPEEFAALQP
jgi:hypothetical protein